MGESSEALWAFFVAAALGLTVLIVALGIALVVAQHRVLHLHREFGRRLLAAQDAERAEVAREVHDGMVQRLGALSQDLTRWIGEAATPLAQHRLGGVASEVNELESDLRRLAQRLHPAALSFGHLGLAFDQLGEEAGRIYGLDVTLDLALDDPRVRQVGAWTLPVYRIVQEALRNVQRHAGVAQATVTARLEADVLEVSVRDEGRGFDVAAKTARRLNGRSGIGLVTMRERARQAGGTMAIHSEPGHGTTVRLRVPLEAEADA